MGNKIVCLNCQKSFNQGTDFKDRREGVCPECGKDMLLLPHLFKPPRKNDDKKWGVVKYLIDNGFHYHHVYENIEHRNGLISYQNYVPYPDNIRDAKAFVEKYQSQKVKLNKQEQ